MSELLVSTVKANVVDTASLVDKGIPTLEAVLDPEVLRRHLKMLPVRKARWGAIGVGSFRLLKWHRGKRCTLELTLKTDSGLHPLIAKVYAKDRPDVHRAMDGMWRTRFGQTERFSVPEPLDYVIPLRLLLEEKVEGRSVKETFLRGDEESRTESAKRSARWLAYFHEHAPLSNKVCHVDQDLIRMEGWTRRFTELGGPIFDKASLLSERLTRASSSLGDVENSAGHGSFSPDHVFLTSDRTATIDWDGYDTGDPARDVARFIVATQRLALGRMGSIKVLDSVVSAFLQTYAEVRGPAVLPRLPFYRAATCLRLVKYGVFHHRVAHWEEKVTAMLGEGLRVLEA